MEKTVRNKSVNNLNASKDTKLVMKNMLCEHTKIIKRSMSNSINKLNNINKNNVPNKIEKIIFSEENNKSLSQEDKGLSIQFVENKIEDKYNIKYEDDVLKLEIEKFVNYKKSQTEFIKFTKENINDKKRIIEANDIEIKKYKKMIIKTNEENENEIKKSEETNLRLRDDLNRLKDLIHLKNVKRNV